MLLHLVVVVVAGVGYAAQTPPDVQPAIYADNSGKVHLAAPNGICFDTGSNKSGGASMIQGLKGDKGETGKQGLKGDRGGDGSKGDAGTEKSENASV